MPIAELKHQIDRLPEQPGVYLFLNAAGETIYVGKARALRGRVRSYLGARRTSAKTDALARRQYGQPLFYPWDPDICDGCPDCLDKISWNGMHEVCAQKWRITGGRSN